MTEPFPRARDQLGWKSSVADTFGTPLVTKFSRAFWPDAVKGRLSILIYHRVLAEPDPLLPDEITVDEFRHDMKMLSSRFTVLSLAEGLHRLRDGTLPPFAVCLTFDDGYSDNCTVALPVLQEFGLSATFFIATGYLDGGRMWNDTLLSIIRSWSDDTIDLEDWGIPRMCMRTLEDRRRAWQTMFRWMRRIGFRGRSEMLALLEERLRQSLPDDLMMKSEDVRTLRAAGMEVGCHTETHPILTRIDDGQVRAEIMASRERLQDLIQAPVRYFAYPNGVPRDDYSVQHVAIVRECGFEAAFSTAWGAARPSSDMFQLPRFTPWDKTGAGFALRLILSRRSDDYQVAA